MQLKHFKLNLFYIAFLIVSINTFGQHSPEFILSKKTFPDASSVRLNEVTIIRASIKNDKIIISQEFLEEDLYLDESATLASKREVSFSSFFEMVEIEASSFEFVNGKYKEYEVDSFLEKDDLDQSFYDDTKTISYILSNLKEGAKSKLSYTENVKNPRFLSLFYFGGFRPIINSKVILIADNDINFIFKEFNTSEINIEFSKKKKKKTTTYTWQVKNINEYEYEYNVPSYKNIFPHIIPIITSYKTKSGNEIEVLGDVSNLYSWYYSLVENINKDEPDEDLKILVSELIKNKDSDLEKVKSIYYWTQQNIKYIAFEYALGGFIPREANNIFKKKYGDCKDNSSILYRMLEIAELEGNLTWIGTRKIPYGYNEVPTPIVDNHMILTYQENGKTYFLDATGRYININYPTSFIQGKEALISNGKDKYKIVKVPIIPSELNMVTDSTTINIVNNDIIGSSKTEVSGYEKANFYHALENKNTEFKLKEFYNAVLQKGNNKFLVDSISEINKYNYDENFIINYSFNIKGYVKAFEDEIFVNMNLEKILSDFKIDENRKNTIQYDYKRAFNLNTTLIIPDGYSLDYFPKDSEFSNELLSCKTTYKIDNNKIFYNHLIKFNYLTLTIDQQKGVNSLIKKAEKEYKEIIILKKNDL